MFQLSNLILADQWHRIKITSHSYLILRIKFSVNCEGTWKSVITLIILYAF